MDEADHEGPSTELERAPSEQLTSQSSDQWAPNWYQDPSGPPGQLRWFDGNEWTDHFHQQAAVTQPALAQPTIVIAGGGSGAAVATTVNVKGPNHALHFILTIVTCGLWLPVWIIIAVFGRRRVQVTNATAAGGGGPTTVVVPTQQQPPGPS